MERRTMKSIKTNTLKLMVVIALLCPAAFADGDMGSGGLAGSEVPNTPVKTVRTTEDDGDMGSGGRISSGSATYLDSVLNSIYDYFDSMI